jgi:signal peptidase I
VTDEERGGGGRPLPADQPSPALDAPGPADPAEQQAGNGEDEHPLPGDGHPGSAADHDGPGQPKRPGKRRGKRRGKRSFLRELPVLIVIALALALLIKTYASQAYYIPSSSMENTLAVGDKVLVNKFIYHLRPIHRGDIIVFNGQGSWNRGPPPKTPNPFDRLYRAVIGLFGAAPGQTDYIKRVIGLPGDHVRCCNARGQVTVNGVALSETSYLYPGNPPSATRFSITVPPGRLWVMGDHRAVSDDSRGHMDPGNPSGTVPESEVIGRAFWIVWPPGKWRVLPIPATFEQPALNSGKPASASSRPAGPDTISARVVPAGPALPLAAALAGAVPLAWAQRRLRQGIKRHRARSR